MTLTPTEVGNSEVESNVGDSRLYLKRLALYCFKNYEELELNFEAPIVCFLGNNGEGKTNLLDAIHYLSFCKSYFNSIDSQNIKHQNDQASITGEFERRDQFEIIHCALRKSARKVFKRNHKDYDRLSEHIGLLPSVIITPYDIELILEGSEIRRKFIDSTISQYSSVYLEHLVQYNQALLQRNNLLKTWGKNGGYNADIIEPWNARLAYHGEFIHTERKKFFEEFTPLFSEVYESISGGKEVVELDFNSDLNDNKFEDLLLRYIEKDRILERTNTGPHKDDIEFMMANLPLKKFASQGQQKSFLISLKLAQYILLKKHSGTCPILLLDDLYDKVDEGRVSNLLNWLIKNHHGQIFITDTHLDRIPKILKELSATYQTFEIKTSDQRPVTGDR